jgi:hypothetical protein
MGVEGNEGEEKQGTDNQALLSTEGKSAIWRRELNWRQR